ncbi:MAG: transcriptional repressor [Prevotella sp.]|jgi:Fur family ferric uptake transcriptional regulator|nr:transcriptional repressor [Prevotella sp.]MCI2102438.1 transcriptional repressor [Prevotella sp.]
MEEERYARILQEHGIKPTANRILVTKSLASARRPLSMTELEATIKTIDKSNIFRSLSLFKEHHLVHAIEDGGGQGERFELCHGHGGEGDEDIHVHFYCEKCHKTFCMDNTPIPVVDLPEGYLQRSASFIVSGICPDCREKTPR